MLLVKELFIISIVSIFIIKNNVDVFIEFLYGIFVVLGVNLEFWFVNVDIIFFNVINDLLVLVVVE